MILAAKSGETIAAMPANSCMPVSNEPPLIAVAVRRGSKTNEVLALARNFSVNWLNYSDRKIVSLLAGSSNSEDKLSSFGITYDRVFEAPVLRKAIAYAICKKKSVIKTGDHDLFTGQLVGAMASLDFDENWKYVEYHPILYLGSELRNPYTTIASHTKRK
jgi:flavin reductase (DIM6/NTAB) family NADH-FMN oxidoreductase RutF